MKPYAHARNSAKKYGGHWEDYMPIHDWFDSSKAHLADMRHRALLHSTFGIFLCEQVFGVLWTRISDGISISVRTLGEDHVVEDLGFIPSVDKWLGNMKFQPWMGGLLRGGIKSRFIPMEDKDNE
jgi:hypothetical protein